MTVRHCWPLTSNTLAGRWLSPQYAKADLSRWSLLCREEQSAASYVGTQTSLLHQRKKLEAETRADPDSDLLWSVPTARSDRAYNWGQSSIAPDAVGQMTAQGLQIPFYFEYELRARHPQGVIARLDPYESYYWSPEHNDDQPPYPVTLFVVDAEDVEATYVRTATRMSRMSMPILVSCIPVLSRAGILGKSWHPLWESESPRLALSGLSAYQWDSLYHRMRHRPVGIDRADTSLSPLHAVWGVQNGTSCPVGGVLRGRRPPHLPLFQLRNGLMDPLTGQCQKMQMAGKPC